MTFTTEKPESIAMRFAREILRAQWSDLNQGHWYCPFCEFREVDGHQVGCVVIDAKAFVSSPEGDAA